MSGNAIQYRIGGDASELGKAFEHGLRYAGDFVNNVKKAFSVRGMFDGITSGLQQALGGSSFGEIFAKSFRAAIGKEQLQQNFEGLFGGDAQKATAMLGALKRFANESGIASAEVDEAARHLITGGGESAARAVQDLKMLGEVALGLGRPIGELATVWAKAFSDGAFGTREMMQFQNAGVDMYAAIAASSGLTREAVKALGEQGGISFEQIETAMKKLTGQSGQFFGQIERHKNSLGGLWDTAKDSFGKIPEAFFSGVITAGMDTAKADLRSVTEILDGWVNSTRQFGTQMGAALTVTKQLNDEGRLFGKDGLVATGLEAGFGKAADVLASGALGAASGFVAVLSAALPKVWGSLKEDVKETASFFADAIKGAMGFDTTKKITPGNAFVGSMGVSKDLQNAILNNPQLGAKLDAAQTEAWGRVTPGEKVGEPAWGKIFMEAARNGGKFDLGAGADAKRRLDALLEGRMFQAQGGERAVMASVLTTIRSALTMGLTGAALNGGGLGAVNESTRLSAATVWKNFAPDALSKIGLHVGAGGPQGEVHARDTAKNTGKTADKVDELLQHVKHGRRGPTTFGGG